jgi:hypothetical protein
MRMLLVVRSLIASPGSCLLAYKITLAGDSRQPLVRVGADVLAVMGLAEIRLPSDQDVHRSLSVMRIELQLGHRAHDREPELPDAPSDERH